MGDSRKAAAETAEMVGYCEDRIREETRCHLFARQYVELHKQGSKIPLTENERIKHNEIKDNLIDLVQEILDVRQRYEIRKALQGFRVSHFETTTDE